MILLLAGTAEGRALARGLAAAGIGAMASYAGAVERIEGVELPMRIGGFGGDDGFRRFLEEAGVTGVIDATHPFAAHVTNRTHRICGAIGVPCLRLERPAWQAVAGDDWREVRAPEELGRIIPAEARVFLAVGVKELDRFRGLRAREVLLRSVDATGDLPEGWRNVAARPPFDVESEAALFTLTGVDWLVCRNAGGAASYPKIEAARRLGLPVAMIARPGPPPGAEVVASVDEALDWARAL